MKKGITSICLFMLLTLTLCSQSTGWVNVRAKQNHRDSVYFYKDANFNGTLRVREGYVRIGTVMVSANGTELNILDGAVINTTELNRLVGVSSNIQTQFESKLAKHDSLLNKGYVPFYTYTQNMAQKAPLSSPTFSGTVKAGTDTLATMAYVRSHGGANPDVVVFKTDSLQNKGYVPFYTYTQNMANKAPITNPTFLGVAKLSTDTLATKAYARSVVASGGINTDVFSLKADSLKNKGYVPFWTYGQNMATKAPINNPTFTGVAKLSTDTISTRAYARSVAGTILNTDDYVSVADSTGTGQGSYVTGGDFAAGLAVKAPLLNANLIGNTTANTIAIGGGVQINKITEKDSSLATIKYTGDTLPPYVPRDRRVQLADVAPLLRDTTVLGSFLYGSGLIRDTADFQNGAIKAFFNPKDTLVVTAAKGVMKEGSGTESVGVNVSWHSSFMSPSATNLTSSPATIISTSTGTDVTTLANNKIPPNSYVWATLSGLTSGNKPSMFLYDLLGFRLRSGGTVEAPCTYTQNLVMVSELLDHDDRWNGSGSSVTATNVYADLEGNITLEEITATTGTASFHNDPVGNPIFVVAGKTYRFSFDVRRGTMADLKYSVYNIQGASDIVAPTSYYSQTSSSYTTRITVQFTAPAGCGAVYVYPVRESGYTGTVYVGRMQVEEDGSCYVETTTSIVTPCYYTQNLVKYSEDIGSQYWEKVGVNTTGVNAANDTEGNPTLEQFTTSSTTHRLYGVVPVVPGKAYRWSFEVKRGTMTDMAYRVYNPTAGNDIIASTSYYNRTNSSIAVRVTVVFVAPANCNSVYVYMLNSVASTGTVFLGRGQVEEDGSCYVETTDTEIASYGPEKVVNGSFGTAGAGWTLDYGTTVVDGIAVCAPSTGYRAFLYQSMLSTLGKTYRVEFEITSYTSGELRFLFGTASDGTGNAVAYTAAGKYVVYYTITDTEYTQQFTFYNWSAAASYSIDNVSVKEVL